jgi:hypothetical protein
MGRGAKRLVRVSIIPEDLQLFEVADITTYFEYLTKTFHVSPKWERHFRESLLKVEKGKSDQEYFFEFMKENLEPALKIILQREDVIFAIARYLIKPRIEEKRKEKENAILFYRNQKP